MKKEPILNKTINNLTKDELILLVEQQENTIFNFEKKDKSWFESSIDGLYRSSLDGRFLDVNSALVKMLGYASKDELLQVDINTQVYNKDLDKGKIVAQSDLETRKIHKVLKKDGSLISVEDFIKKVKDDDGKVLYYEGVVKDISHVVKAKKIQKILLKISQKGHQIERLRDFNKIIKIELGKLIDTTNFYIAFLNREKQTINVPYISGEKVTSDFPAAKSMTGYLIRNNKPLLLNAEQYQDLIDTGKVQLIGIFPKAWLGVPLQVDDVVLGAIVVQSYTDEKAFKEEDIQLLEFISSQISIILHRKKVDRKNNIAKEIFRKVLDIIPVNIFWKDLNSKFLGVNKSFLKEMNLKDESEIIGKSDLDFHSDHLAQKYFNDEQEMMKSGLPILNYIETQIKDGKEHPYLSSKLPFFDEKNEVIGLIGITEDITDKVEYENKLKKATDEAIAANLSKSSFLANMSHEIRTPMNAILGYSQLLQEDENITVEQHENLKTINRSGEHLLALINDILDMSKIEAGRIQLHYDVFDFNLLLKDIEKLFYQKALDKNLDLSISLGLNVPKYIIADEAKIRQVIINLLGNAIKFTQDGFISVQINNVDDKMIVKVRDTGKGISKEEHETIFKPFEQAKKGGETKGGTGLGLAISKKFAQLMEGDITVDSQLGRGSVFAFSFKFKEGKQLDASDKKPELKVVSLLPEYKGLKLAIVDDRFENRDILLKKLKPLGFDIKMAENGLEAVELYENWRPEIVLMDIVMPIMDGVEATRKIFEIANGHDVKVFVISASALESEQEDVMRIGATVFIKKPVIFSDLIFELEDKGNVKFEYKDIAEKTAVVSLGSSNDISLMYKAKFIKAAYEQDNTLLHTFLLQLEGETQKSFEYLENCINDSAYDSLINWIKN